jgi:hypothetical protein
MLEPDLNAGNSPCHVLDVGYTVSIKFQNFEVRETFEVTLYKERSKSMIFCLEVKAKIMELLTSNLQLMEALSMVDILYITGHV